MYCSDRRLVYLGLDKKIEVYLSKEMATHPDKVKVIRLNDRLECQGNWRIDPETGLSTFNFEKGDSIGHYYLVE